MRILGIDPDLHTLGWAVVDDIGLICGAGVLRVPDKIKGTDAVLAMLDRVTASLTDWWQMSLDVAVVETQHYVDKGSRVKVQSILDLALVSGCVAGAIHDEVPRTIFASPKTWTKGWKKEVRHARLMKRYGWTDEADAARTLGITRGPVIHTLDAVDLARWGHEVLGKTQA